jgi:hypothetical protein
MTKHGCTSRFSWTLFLSWMLLLVLGRIVTDVLLFGQERDIPIRFHPQPLKGNELVSINSSFRRIEALIKKVPRQAKWSNIATDLDESPCETDDLFQYGMAFIPGPVDQDSISLRESVPNAKDCCRLCELSERCTHWTFEVSKARCSISNASPHPISTIDLQGAVSARASLNKYIARRHVSSIPRPEHSEPLNCAFDEDDRPFLDDSYNKSAKTMGENTSQIDGHESLGALLHP